MATQTVTRPAPSAPRSKWAEYADTEYELETGGMTRKQIIAAIEELDDAELLGEPVNVIDSDVDEDEDIDDIADVPDSLVFTSELDRDDDEDELPAIPIEIDGIKWLLSPPSPTALALRIAEYSAAQNLQDQYLAMLGIISTSLDQSGFVYLRQRMLEPARAGKKFNEALIGTILTTILERWGAGQSLPEPGQNRAQRRANELAKRRATKKNRK